VRDETGAATAILVLGVASTGGVLVVFATTTLVDEPATVVALAVILGLSVAADFAWKQRRGTELADRGTG
jgi:hypothetical protein